MHQYIEYKTDGKYHQMTGVTRIVTVSGGGPEVTYGGESAYI